MAIAVIASCRESSDITTMRFNREEAQRFRLGPVPKKIAPPGPISTVREPLFAYHDNVAGQRAA